MLIYFARHGITSENSSDFFQTSTTPLCSEGRVQASRLAQRLRKSGIKRIYSSAMARAVQTADIIGNELEIPIVQSALLEEIHRPSAVRGKSKFDPSTAAIMKEVRAHFSDRDWKHSDEENFYELAARAQQAIRLIITSSDDQILVVTHGEILRMILALLIFGDSITPDIFPKLNSVFATSNAGLTVVTKDHRGWYIRTWNEETFLSRVQYQYTKLSQKLNGGGGSASPT